ncbi:hypothetical protein C8Q79DRAFT_926703 [Trametes meyenii]|nr:hypothetical protein C8Q79DRAFT_926703 [Trametes meyenii]
MSRLPEILAAFPDELYDDVFSRLNQTEWQRMALVCKAWLPEANRNLWRYPIISNCDSVQKILPILQSSASHRDAVRGIRIRGNAADRRPMTEGTPEATEWVKLALMELSPYLPNVISLTLETWNGVTFCDHMVGALRDLGRRVTELHISYCTFAHPGNIEDLIFSLPNLTVLRLDAVRWPDNLGFSSGKSKYTGRSLKNVKSLIMRGTYDYASLFCWLAGYQCRPARVQLFYVDDANIQIAAKYLEFIGSRLEVLDFKPALRLTDRSIDVVNMVDDFLRSSLNNRLRALTLRIHDANEWAVWWVPRILDNAHSAPLEEITFHMTLSNGRIFETEPWINVRHIFNSSQQWHRTLKKVRFVHQPVQDTQYRCLQDARDIFRYYFDSLQQRGLLEAVNAEPINLEGA